MTKMKSIRSTGKKKIDLDEIASLYGFKDYRLLVELIREKIEEGLIEAIKSSSSNGKNPPLYSRYRIIYPEEDNEKYKDELLFNIHSSLKIDYYLKNIDKYKEDRKYILQLSDYIKGNKDFLNEVISINERSFEIWNREKYLKKEGGIRILKNLGLDTNDLSIYETTEPLSYYSHHKKPEQIILILENKDTFYSMRKHLIDGNKTILGLEIGSLVYGKGKGILKSFEDFSFCVEPYLADKSNRIIYFGDLDYEGILIYEQLRNIFLEDMSINLFKEAYLAMMKKSKGLELPFTKKGQNKNIGSYFLDSFEEEEKIEILEILENNRYIPQEILNTKDF